MPPSPLHVLLTGAASGLGRGLALYLGSKGHRLVLTDVNTEGLRETVRLMGDAGRPAAERVLDVTPSEQVSRLLAGLADDPIQVLINNAGLQHVSRLEEFPEERPTRTLRSTRSAPPTSAPRWWMPRSAPRRKRMASAKRK